MNDSRESRGSINTAAHRKISSAAGRNFRFWGRATLEALGIILMVAAGLFIFYSVGNGDFSSEQKMRDWLAVAPYYLYLGGVFSILMMTVGYFQVYFSLLVSMNNKRTTVAAGILFSTFFLIVFVNAGAWLLWTLNDTEAARTSVKLVPVFTGACFMTGAFSMILGVIIIRWGKIGTIILTVICMMIGGLFGAGLIAMDGILEFMLRFVGEHVWTIIVAGLVLYGLSGVFAMAAVRKVEIRS